MQPRYAGLATLLSSLALTATAYCLEIEDDAVFIRVIDTGPGHASVIRMPGDQIRKTETPCAS